MDRVLVVALLSALLPFPAGQDQATWTAEGIGRIEVTSSFPAGGFPTANFRDDSGHILYSVSLGHAESDIFRINPLPSDAPTEWSKLGPSKLVYFVLNHTAHPSSVLAIAQYTGGSDCEYVPALIGPVNGRLKSLLQQEPVVNSQGGFFVGDLGANRGFGLAAWTFIWEDGAHYGKHRYRVRLYRIDPAVGTSSLAFDSNTRRKYAQGTDALKEFGFGYENMLSNSSLLGC